MSLLFALILGLSLTAGSHWNGSHWNGSHWNGAAPAGTPQVVVTGAIRY